MVKFALFGSRRVFTLRIIEDVEWRDTITYYEDLPGQVYPARYKMGTKMEKGEYITEMDKR